MGRKYPKVQPGEWVYPRMTGYKMACCDCGLVHALDFEVVDDIEPVVRLRAFRDNRATAAMRRKRKYRPGEFVKEEGDD
jgi:hypothetical protein